MIEEALSGRQFSNQPGGRQRYTTPDDVSDALQQSGATGYAVLPTHGDRNASTVVHKDNKAINDMHAALQGRGMFSSVHQYPPDRAGRRGLYLKVRHDRLS